MFSVGWLSSGLNRKDRIHISDLPGDSDIPETPLRECPLIFDGEFIRKLTEDDWDFVNEGEKQGWLKYTGYHEDGNNIVWYRFEHVGV